MTESCSKVAQQYYCKKCDYYTVKKSSFDKHIDTKKHKVTFSDGCHIFSDAKVAHVCDNCEKIYFSRNGLWVHKKKCLNLKNNYKKEQQNSSIDKDDLIIMLLKQNSELLGIVKNGTNQITNNTNTNCMNNNKTFNLQFFLNETCKDAMNIMDFVESIKLQLTDLEKIGEIGYVEGISNIITTNLKALDITQRPVHCTDKKRETMYIKDEDKWEKEDDSKSKLKKVIKRVANKNIRLLPQFREKNPDYNNADSNVSDKYSKMVIEAMGGVGGNDTEKEEKIIHNISKCTIIDKHL